VGAPAHPVVGVERVSARAAGLAAWLAVIGARHVEPLPAAGLLCSAGVAPPP
jgi:hypothetical protein